MSFDKISDEQLKEEEELFPPVPLEISYANVVIVDNLPVIPRDKEQKLLGVVKKIFEQFGTVKQIFMPFVKEESQGFAFLEYTQEDHAKTAVEKLNNYKLDKQHVFQVNRYEDFEHFSRISPEYQPPPNDAPEQEVLLDWLLDVYGRDQFVLRYGDETEVMWQGVPGETPHQDTKKNKWTDSFVSWSPRGTYLVTYHKLGVILWGGGGSNAEAGDWKKVKRFRHTGVSFVDFSPNEKYLVTCSPMEQDNPEDPSGLVIWDIQTGQKLRGFVKLGNMGVWPEFQWSHDDRHFSRINKGMIGVYEAPEMKLVDKKPVELHAPIVDHAWSPTHNYLAAFTPENQSIPARVVLMEIPSRKIVGQQALFNVVGCRMHWQEDGKFLAIKVDRHGKSKKQTFTSFEFFRIGPKEIPIEHLELEDNVIAFAWEPKGTRFAIIHDADSQTSTRPNISFYDMGVRKLEKLVTLERRPANHLYWSPAGRHIVLAGLKSLNGKLEFYDVKAQQMMATEKEHNMCTDVSWDPTGRYVTTWVSNWKSKSENGYRIWPFHGQNELVTVAKDPFYQFMWRPRPPSLLTPQHVADIDKNFKDFQKKYQKEDKQKDALRSKEQDQERNVIRSTFRQLLGKKKREWEEDKEWRQKFGLDSGNSQGDFYLVEEVVEEVIEEKVEPSDGAAVGSKV